MPRCFLLASLYHEMGHAYKHMPQDLDEYNSIMESPARAPASPACTWEA